VTIRKSFVKEPVERLNIEKKDVEKELKEVIKDLKANLELAKIELDEIDTKNDSLNEENKKLEDTIEDLYEEKGKLLKDIKIMSDENESVKARIKEVTKQKEDLSNKLDTFKRVKDKEYDDKCDMVDILESTIKNKDHELDKIKKELESLQGSEEIYRFKYNCDLCSFMCNLEPNFGKHMKEEHENNLNSNDEENQNDEDVPSTSKCGQCDYESEGESDLEKHVEVSHAQIIECKICNLVCKSEEKLENHMCRVTIRNPSFCDFYTNNWIVTNRCTSIYHRINKDEVALLHCKDYIESKRRCIEKFPLWLPAQEDQIDGVWHLELSKFLKDGRIQWKDIKMLVKTD
jgi:uncharacterized protein (UPF0335 family)